MSRNEKQEREEIEIDLDEINSHIIYDEWGQKICFGDIYKDKKTIVIFLRHFLCFMGKEYVDDLALIPEKMFKDTDVQLVLIGCASWKFIEGFREDTGYAGLLFVDPDRTLYKGIGCLESIKADSIKDSKVSKHIKSGVFMGILKSAWRGMKYRQMQGDLNQLGGAFVIGPGAEVHYQHFDLTAADQAPINDLLLTCGLSPVNFENDQRVLTV
ncbi:hypothetical protein CAPTEDRAFT_183827 [Capitella teleta]|uniref:Uncharacterized protein n=1 Tax=Capitella teleta TaxID=283909 RepID=R7THC5_CAPTE|nr:hypothetical protein CAPTEDRAFT_183827 [Capitella teleta]|eukprot:ELT93208.1 hypothetical protein CAPTEDRAFT_183827 [Capitella teleta]